MRHSTNVNTFYISTRVLRDWYVLMYITKLLSFALAGLLRASDKSFDVVLATVVCYFLSSFLLTFEMSISL